jgi:hypothetical protein
MTIIRIALLAMAAMAFAIPLAATPAAADIFHGCGDEISIECTKQECNSDGHCVYCTYYPWIFGIWLYHPPCV